MPKASVSPLQGGPAILQSSSAAARAYQRSYLRWLGAHLLLLGATAFLSAWSPRDLPLAHRVDGLIAILMFFALVLTLTLKLAALDDRWFRTRAIAESVKAATWRFVMRPGGAEDAESFLDELHQLRRRFPRMDAHIARFGVSGDEITPAMLRLRSMTLAERTDVYSTHRLQDQIDWYRESAKANAVADSISFRAITVLEVLAIIAAASRMFVIREYNPTGAVAALSACLLAWSQAKKFSELAGAYSAAHSDLNELKSRAQGVQSEADLARLVNDVEAVVSREHRSWVARRV